jgi:prephenate dehydrogenase
VPRELPVIQPLASADPPLFPRIAIVGFGLIGGSIALAVKERWPGTLVIAVDRKPVLETAMRMHAADVSADDLGMAAGADLIVLAAPVSQIIARLAELPEFVAEHALITDVGSTKSAIMEAAGALPERLRFVGGHPLAGAATGGVEAARADLFRGRPWLLMPAADDEEFLRLEQFVEGLGADPVRMTASAHDPLLAYLSHLPQLTISALMHVVGESAGSAGLALAGRGLRETTRLATSPPDVWRDITATNAAAVGDAIDRLIAALQRLRGDLLEGRVLSDVFASAAEWKRVLEQSRQDEDPRNRKRPTERKK